MALRRFLLLLVFFGIAFGPAIAGAATPVVTHAMEAHQSALPAADNPNDMSCCPHEQRTQKGNCGPSCPLALVCSLVNVACESHADWSFRRMPRAALSGPLSDNQRPSALVEPPSHPPKA